MTKKSVSTTCWYGVRVGRQPGVYSTWEKCRQQVASFRKPMYRKFSTKAEADRWVFVNNHQEAFLCETMNSIHEEETAREVESPCANDGEAAGTEPKKVDPRIINCWVGISEKNGGATTVYFGNNDTKNKSFQYTYKGAATKKRLRIAGCVRAISTVIRMNRGALSILYLHCGSSELAKVINYMIPIWAKNCWMDGNGNIVDNKDLYSFLHTQLKSCVNTISVTAVYDQPGSFGNEMEANANNVALEFTCSKGLA